jgi:hypothetical protein
LHRQLAVLVKNSAVDRQCDRYCRKIKISKTKGRITLESGSEVDVAKQQKQELQREKHSSR